MNTRLAESVSRRLPSHQSRGLELLVRGALIAASASLAWAVGSQQTVAMAASANVSLAGVHWYSGDSAMLDTSLPLGERGWNVEVIFDAGWCDGDRGTDPGGVRAVAQTAKDHGLVNIIRVDYHDRVAVPPNSGDYAAWGSSFIKCTSELSDLASLYIVGNEPNIEGNIGAAQYAAAFNHLYARRAEMPAGTQLLATFNSPFTPPAWMNEMASALSGVDGFALHTGGIRGNCQDPRQACSFGNWNFDGAFRYYRDVINNIPSGWWSRPVYITEFNTFTGDPGSEPQNNYIADWINKAFEEVRNYNAARGSKPPVRALAWFVDRPQSWPLFSLRNIPAARTDMGEEFKNPANRGGPPLPTAPPQPTATLPPPTLPPGLNVALGKAWQASSVYNANYGGDKAVDGLVSAASKWTSNGASPESWLALDLGQTYNLTGFVVRHAGAAGEPAYFNTQAFRLESGPSFSGPWTTLASVNNAAQTQNVSSVLLTASARFVRLTITDAGIDNYARIPEFEVYASGSLNPTPTPIPPTPGPAGPLQNGGFEGAVQPDGVGANWTSFSSSGYGASFAVVSDVVHAGTKAQRVHSQPSSDNQFAGVFQTVATTPGASYTLRAWNRVSLPGGSGWPLVGRLGIDLTGGTNYAAASVSWVEFDAPENGVGNWVQRERSVTASGTRTTIFLQSWRKWASGGASDTWFDDVEVLPQGGVPPTATPPPQPTATLPPPTLPPGLNVALGKAWQASSVYNANYGGDKAVDGLVSAASKWTSNGASPESWLALDLGQTYNLTGFVVRHAGAASEPAYFNTQAFRLESGPSFSGPWTTLASVNNGAQTQNVSSVLLTASARFVRLTITDAGIDNYARIPEFEVYAQGTVTPPPSTPPPSPTTPPPPTATMPPDCPAALDFAAIRAQLNQQGQDLAFVKIGFHVQAAGNHTGLGKWEQCLDAAGVPFFLKSVSDAGKIMAAADLKVASGVPHTLVYRKCCQENGQDYELPDYNLPPYDAAVQHWQRHLQALHQAFTITRCENGGCWSVDVLDRYKSLFWVETINEPNKEISEWLGAFSYYTAQMAIADGFNYAAFAWSSGEPEPEHWLGPPGVTRACGPSDPFPSNECSWMRTFLELAAANPDRVAVSLHEYEYFSDDLQGSYPNLVGRFEALYQAADALGILRPTVVITEFGWPGGPSSAQKAMQVDYPWAAQLYAGYPEVKGAAIWCLGSGCSNQNVETIGPMTDYALQHYFVIPLQWVVYETQIGPQGASHLEGVPASVTDGDPSTTLTVVQDAGEVRIAQGTLSAISGTNIRNFLYYSRTIR